MPQSRRQNLFELDEGTHGRLLDAGHRAAGGGAQPDRDGDRLLVVEQQRWELRAGTEPVAGDAGGRVHRVAEGAQLVDVAADGPHVDFEALGQLGAGPVAGGLQQGQQAEQPRRGFQHVRKSASRLGQKLSS